MIGLTSLYKPEYLMNPRQLIRRLSAGSRTSANERTIVELPWGWPIEIWSQDNIGRALIHLGIYDLTISETLWRLCDHGETALDLGANVGTMTALLAKRVGKQGKVIAFEAHPDIVEELRSNVDRWRNFVGDEAIEIHARALSDRAGTIGFEIPADFKTNRGIGRVERNPEKIETGSRFINVPCETLDSVLGDGRAGVAKMDVEGHEQAVLEGSLAILREKRVRDWVFEHHPDYPSPVTDLFESNGYTLFQLDKRLFSPALVPMSQPLPRPVWEARNLLATADPERASNRMKGRGWKVLAG